MTPSMEVQQGLAALHQIASLVKAIKPSENVRKGDTNLHRAGELLRQYQDDIPEGLLDDVLLAQDLATSVREAYETAKEKMSFLNVGQRVLLAREYKKMARRALDRTVHVTGLAMRVVAEQRAEERFNPKAHDEDPGSSAQDVAQPLAADPVTDALPSLPIDGTHG
ncbi:hypothetical protein EIP86_008800 [Pleurotus ostreatoroseus]|nr:hypothetical protein EIP86_008800 [Pleurotus ostreatoroseus]